MMNCTGLWWSTLLHSTTTTKHTTKAATAECRSSAEKLREQVLSVHASSTSPTF
jgi:hypothetical protein